MRTQAVRRCPAPAPAPRLRRGRRPALLPWTTRGQRRSALPPLGKGMAFSTPVGANSRQGSVEVRWCAAEV